MSRFAGKTVDEDCVELIEQQETKKEIRTHSTLKQELKLKHSPLQHLEGPLSQMTTSKVLHSEDCEVFG